MVYRAGPQHRNERARREACLRALVEDSAAAGGRLVLDQDDGMLSWDNQQLIELTPGGWCCASLSMTMMASLGLTMIRV